MNLRESLQSAANALAGGELHRAMQLLSTLLASHPREPNALRLMGVVLLHAGNPNSALDFLQRALDVDPASPRSHGTLASALYAVGRLDDAVVHAAKSVELDPLYTDGHMVLGMVQTQRGDLTAAIEALRRATSLRPGDSSAHNLLGNALSTAGRNDAAIAAYRKAVESQPASSVAHDNLLMALNHESGDDGNVLFAEHLAWADRHTPAPVEPADKLGGDRNPDRPLRIVYLSPDFRRHAVSCFFEPLLGAHDRDQFNITLLASVQVEDDVSRRLAQQADSWINVLALSDAQLRQRIHDERIDIVVDLAGHTAGNRLRALAPRAAPVQVSYLGYPNTTGVPAIEWLITDVDLDPAALATDRWHTERLIRLPRTMHCYCPPDDAPPVESRPAGGQVCFGSFNRLEKLTDKTIELWSGALAAVPASTLTVKTPALADAETRQRLTERFAARGVAPDRLTLLARDATAGTHLGRYGQIDIALDSYPYNGTTTTCEALWMGVPVVTLVGPTRVARTTGGILRAIGLTEFCARDPADFRLICEYLADDESRRRTLRKDLRDRMLHAPLMDAAGLARAVEAALRACWKSWCAGGASPSTA